MYIQQQQQQQHLVITRHLKLIFGRFSFCQQTRSRHGSPSLPLVTETHLLKVKVLLDNFSALLALFHDQNKI
jgi:hypothetical protein